MNNKELRKSIRRILKENLENSDWVNASDAQKAAMQDIDSEDEFEHLGTNRFEKDFDVEDFLYDLEAQKNMSEPSVKRLEKQIGQLKRFGKGSLNELSPEIRQTALKKAVDYIEQPGDTYHKDPLQYIKKKNQANSFISHVNPELKKEAMEIAKMIDVNCESRIEKEAVGSTLEPNVVLYFGQNIADLSNQILKIAIKKDNHTWETKKFIPENIQRRLANFIKKIQTKEISSPVKQLNERFLGGWHYFATPEGKEEYIKDLESKKINAKGEELEQIEKELKKLKSIKPKSLKEETSKLDKPKDSAGNSISSGVRVEDLESGSAGRVERFGIDDKGQLTVHVAWITKYGQIAPKSIVYPKNIIVKDSAKKITDEGIKDTLKNIYKELNPIEKWKQMKENRKKLEKEVSDLRREVSEKEKELEKIVNSNHIKADVSNDVDEGIGAGLSLPIKKGAGSRFK